MRRLLRRIDPVLILVLFLALPALAPLFAPGYFYEAHDGRHSVFYQIMFDASLRDGALWPRWAMHHLQGYGYPTFIILAPLGFWLSEIFVLLGAGFTTAARLTWATGVLLSAWGMLRLLEWWLIRQPGAPGASTTLAPVLGRRIHPLRLAAAAGALLYIYAPYRLADLYVRGALNESLLFLWLPWLLLAWDRLLVLRGPGARRRWALAVVTLSGMWLTHSFAILSLTPLLMLWVLFRLVERWRNDRLERGAGVTVAPGRALAARAGLAASAGVGALLLAAVFLAPLVVESPLLDQQVYISDTYSYRNHFVHLGQYFSPFWGYGYSDDPAGANDGMGFQLGAVSLALVLASLTVLRRAPRSLRAIMRMLALTAALLLFVMTPWSRALWDAVPTLAVIQFPWRLLVAASFVLAAQGGLLLGLLSHQEEAQGQAENEDAGAPLAGPLTGRVAGAGAGVAGAGVLFFGLLAMVGTAGYASPALQPVEPWREDGRAIFRFEQQFPDMIVGTLWTSEPFTDSPMSAGYADPAYSEERGRTESLQRLAILEGEGSVLLSRSAGSTFGGDVAMETPGVVRIHLLDFPGWQVTLDGETVAYRRSGPIGLLEVDVPAGTHSIEARMGTTPARRAGSISSWAMVLLLVGMVAWPPRRRQDGERAEEQAEAR
jgi:hypothetical protein